MAPITFADYAGLQNAVAQWLNRDDLKDAIPAFITLCESKLKRKLRDATVQKSVPLATAAFNLPDDCAQLRSVRLVTGVPRWDKPLDVMTPELLDVHRTRNMQTGRPRYAAILAGPAGQTLLVAPAPDQVYTAELTYFYKLVPLSDTNPTNRVLQEAPDAYLYGALMEAEPFLENDERLPLWTSKYTEAVSDLNLARTRAEYGASPQPVGLPVCFG